MRARVRVVREGSRDGVELESEEESGTTRVRVRNCISVVLQVKRRKTRAVKQKGAKQSTKIPAIHAFPKAFYHHIYSSSMSQAHKDRQTQHSAAAFFVFNFSAPHPAFSLLAYFWGTGVRVGASGGLVDWWIYPSSLLTTHSF